MNGHTYATGDVRDVAQGAIRAICHRRGDTRLADVVVADCGGDDVRACAVLRQVADTGDLTRLQARSRAIVRLRTGHRELGGGLFTNDDIPF